jgi:RNA polymerase sigma-70 factor (ECF subfamily)
MANSENLFCNELQQGNLKLFNQLFEDYYVNLCRFAYTYVKDTATSEEIVQNLFVSIWENRNNLNIQISVRAFLYTSVKNKALNYLRNEKTRKGHENEFAHEQALKVEQMIDLCEHEELQQLIKEAIEDLPTQCRTIFEMSRLQNLTYNEIASQLNISPKTVEAQMSIALKKLRSKLSPFLSILLSVI